MGNRMRLLTSSPTNGWRRCGVNDQFPGELPQICVGFLFPRISLDAKHPRQHTDDIAVKNRRRLIEGNAANRAGGVTSDSGQGEYVVEVFGKFVGDDVLVSP